MQKIFRFPCYKKYSAHKKRLKAATALYYSVVTTSFFIRICYKKIQFVTKKSVTNCNKIRGQIQPKTLIFNYLQFKKGDL